jgi:hypothetical protein
MKQFTLDQLLLENKPERFKLFNDLVGLFARSPYLSHVFIRESLSRSICEQDHDMVLAFDTASLAPVVETLDTLLAQEFNLLFPGLLDANGRGSDYLGFTYLFGVGRNLHQVRILLTDTESVRKLPHMRRMKLLRSNGRAVAHEGASRAPVNGSGSYGVEQHFIEVLLRGLDVQLRIRHSQIFLNYEASHRLLTALKNLLRAAFDPQRMSDGWYNLVDGISRTPLGKQCLSAFEGVVCSPAVHDQKSLSTVLHTAHEIVGEVAPEVCERHAESIEFYFKCFDAAYFGIHECQ